MGFTSENTVDDSISNHRQGSNGRLIIAVDFGTTFSSVAYVRLEKDQNPEDVTLDDVRCINNYPDYRPQPGVLDLRQDVPTEIWYDPNAKQTPPNQASTYPEDDVSDYDQREGHFSSSDYDSDLGEQENIQATSSNGRTHIKAPWVERRPRYWGFGVQKQLNMVDIPKAEESRIARFKLLLDQKKETERVRLGLAPIFSTLRRRRFIKKDTDVITHYLTHLLQHTKNELQILGQLEGSIPIEFVMCVPAKWPAKGCRIMQDALKTAVKEAGMGNKADDGVCNLFIVSEPEAAATSVLAENDEVQRGETIVILDAGGGTVDAVTYQVTRGYPLRLASEVVQPDSQLCGASYINEKFERLLMQKLKDERYLETNGKTIKSIVEAQIINFENGEKRTFNATVSSSYMPYLFIDNLREDPNKKGQYQNRLEITRKEMVDVFHDPSLKGTKRMLKAQLELAKDRAYSVSKVILTGGFGQSPSLQSYLHSCVRKERNFEEGEITLLTASSPSTAVARGAVLRALNKEHGPARKSQCSYGFLRTEPYEPENYPAHAKTRCKIEPTDGMKYVDNAIHWLIKTGDDIPHKKTFVFPVEHRFPSTWKDLKCEETLYVSDEFRESHYRRSHPKNKGAELAGVIVADMNFLRTEGLIQLQRPEESSKSRNSLFWSVKLELALIVEGRNLRYEARWPISVDLPPGQQQDVKATGQICIAAAFEPGTK
ncbi:Hsp70 family protein-like protein [Clohesyomyces aquaticus]|uniref:Hsp70 family protein-like protein n=1 Tax=Clohesyomyces aquaticus TaxID=1231657 RepID=A0A1Y2A2L2_9PLEO|nr:Hsp70 family protein-like protein [Clohesyomyces aquaticus]